MPIERNLKRIFTFIKKRGDVKIVFSICFVVGSYWGSTSWTERAVPPSSFLRNHSQHQAIKALNCVFEPRYFILTHAGHRKQHVSRGNCFFIPFQRWQTIYLSTSEFYPWKNGLCIIHFRVYVYGTKKQYLTTQT